jgi:hypothetical protein
MHDGTLLNTFIVVALTSGVLLELHFTHIVKFLWCAVEVTDISDGYLSCTLNRKCGF